MRRTSPSDQRNRDDNDIEKFGQGRYAQLKGLGILMSTSDNSDPRINGRRYYIVAPGR